MGDTDELHGLRKTFYVGAWQQVVNEATNPGSMPRTEAAKQERRVYLYRAYVAQRRFVMATNEIADADPVELKAVRALARHSAAASSEQKDAALAETRALVQEGPLSPLLAVLAATVFYNHDVTDEALRVLHPFPKNLEAVALTTQTLLKMNRVDLAKKEIAAVKAWADDATLAQMIEAWANLFPSAEDKFHEAFYTFDEIASSNTATAKLLTSKAVCKIHAGKFDEAEDLLGSALNWDNNNAEALINFIVCAHATGKPNEVIARYMNQLRDAAPHHMYLQEVQLKQDMFDRAAQRFAV
ncbi:coatomer epsilon subunit-domain-containing protein [Chytriomyces sp. MP71]|nr:coatomer epsilon subunit-domain-containing protein [Chytriomyces sp. MP71]